MRYIVWSIQNKAQLPMPSMRQLSQIAPFIEMDGTADLEKQASPRTMTTHIPFHVCPQHPQAKYIYVARDPRDACVSFFHFNKVLKGLDPSLAGSSFEQFFDKFVRGDLPYGDFFDHVKDWWSRRGDANVLFTTYEQMKKDPRSVVLQVARFISDPDHDYEAMLLQNDASLLNLVIENTSFAYMKKNVRLPFGPGDSSPSVDVRSGREEEISFFRKGIVGDWNSHLSAQQLKRLAKRQADKWSGTELMDYWSA